MPIGARDLICSGSFTVRFDELKVGVLGLNSGAVIFGLNSKAPALRKRGDPNGEDGTEDVAKSLELLWRIKLNGSIDSLREL